MPVGADVQLTPLELAAGIVVGTVPGVGRGAARPGEMPLVALERAVLAGVRRPPCLVSFSGGVDSTLVLAVAARVARREGLPEPIPITWRFEDAPRAFESVWQERAVAELGITDWQRIAAGPDELDFVGPIATRVLAAHGVMYPANAFLHEPLARRAAGGSLLTGVGGDQVLGLWRGRRLADLLARRPRLSWREPLRLARDGWRATRVDAPAWLQPAARRRVEHRHLRELASDPPWWSGHVRFQLRRREVALGQRTLEVIARGAGACVISPLLDGRFVEAVARAGGRLGFGDRRETVRALFADVVPRAVLDRRDKALFDEVLWGGPSRALIRAWDGCGVDRSLVDPGALRAAWSSDAVDYRTALLVQSVWSRTRLARGE